MLIKLAKANLIVTGLMTCIILVVWGRANSAIVATGCDGAGNCYVRAAATGSGNGSDWANACKSFSGACDVTWERDALK